MAWAWLYLSLTPQESFLIVAIIYAVSITIALSPLGEILLRFIDGCREPATEQERNYLLPLFEEVYEDAKQLNPKLNNGIKIYIMDAMYVNAFAMGRQTVAVTKGAMETFTADELKGILAHELGHISYGHTKARLLTVIGNFFFTVMILLFKIVLVPMQFISNIMARFSVIGIGFAVIAFIAQFIVNLAIFLFVHVSHIILALNSRANEIQADTFAYDIGYGRELTSSMYLLQKISMDVNIRFWDKIKATHPHIAKRIANLERLENEGYGLE